MDMKTKQSLIIVMIVVALSATGSVFGQSQVIFVNKTISEIDNSFITKPVFKGHFTFLVLDYSLFIPESLPSLSLNALAINIQYGWAPICKRQLFYKTPVPSFGKEMITAGNIHRNALRALLY